MSAKMLFAALIVALTQGGSMIPHAPVTAAGDHANLSYDILASTPPNGKMAETAATVDVRATSANSATVVVTIGDKSKTTDLPFERDGVLDVGNHSVSDLVSMYNFIPRLLDTSAAHLTAAQASWSATIPVKLSQTQWKDIPVDVHSAIGKDGQVITLAGSHQDVIMAQGFTVSADVKVNGSADFHDGNLRKAHLDVTEVIHAFKDIPLSYHLTISPQQV